MVCIAAFIILAIVGVFVAVLSIFKPKLWKSYTKALKKAWGCLWTKVRLQKCETGFKDDVKNTLLSRIMLKHPKWVKPLSIIIEILSIVIVVVVVWAILTSIKSLLALWALGTCNVTKPAACTLGAEVCSIDEAEPNNPLEATGRWFTEWGEIFEAIPEKFKNYQAEDYDFNYIDINNTAQPIALDIFDPGCLVCASSYKAQKSSGFFDKYNVHLVPFAIKTPEGDYKFKNSEIIVRYMFAAEEVKSHTAIKILDKIFTAKNSEEIPYQNKFNEDYTAEEAEAKLKQWLKDFGLKEDEITQTAKIASSQDVSDKINQNYEIVTNSLKVKGIPTMIYDGEKHTGLYKAN